MVGFWNAGGGFFIGIPQGFNVQEFISSNLTVWSHLTWAGVRGAGSHDDRWKRSIDSVWGGWQSQLLGGPNSFIRGTPNGLIPGTSYDHQVRAKDGDGNASGASATRTLVYDDQQLPPVSDVNIQVEDTTITVLEGSTTTFRVKLTSQPSENVVISASESDADISVAPATRTFTPFNWDFYQSFTVTGIEDADTFNDSATINLIASGGSTDTAIINVTITDDDTPLPPSIPTPANLMATATQIDADLTSENYYATFEYDDNSSFLSPARVYDTVLSTLHSGLWTAPTGTSYIRARFTTAANDGGTRGSWSSTLTYTGATPPPPPPDPTSQTMNFSGTVSFVGSSKFLWGTGVVINSAFGSGTMRGVQFSFTDRVTVSGTPGSTLNSGVSCEITAADSANNTVVATATGFDVLIGAPGVAAFIAGLVDDESFTLTIVLSS